GLLPAAGAFWQLVSSWMELAFIMTADMRDRLQRLILPYLPNRNRKGSIKFTSYIMKDMGVHPDVYDDLIEDITDEFDISYLREEIIKNTTGFFNRLRLNMRPEYILKPPDLTPNDILEIAEHGS